MEKWVINQDRDEIFKIFDFCDLQIEEVKLINRIVGFNVLYEDNLIGTFDTFERACEEMQAIINTEDEIYVTSGYSNFDDIEDDDIEEDDTEDIDELEDKSSKNFSNILTK